jgi:hypothetical protein
MNVAVYARMRRQQSRGWWRRLERRAIAAYQRDLLAELRTLAGESGDIEALDASPGSGGEVLRLQISGRLLTIAWVLPTTATAVGDAAAAGPLRIVDAGRYGRMWWITVSSGATETVVGGSRLRLTPVGGGARHQQNAGWDAPSLTL